MNSEGVGIPGNALGVVCLATISFSGSALVPLPLGAYAVKSNNTVPVDGYNVLVASPGVYYKKAVLSTIQVHY